MMVEFKKPSVLRRLVRYGLPAFGVAACAAGLYVGYCERQTQETVAQLRALNVGVECRNEPFPWWANFTSAIGLSPQTLPLCRRQFHIVIKKPADSADALRLVSRLPGVSLLMVNDSPDCDDAALGLVRNCTSVELLLLDRTSVSDQGIQQLTRWDRLQWFGAKKSRVTDASKPFLMSLPSIRSINLYPDSP